MLCRRLRFSFMYLIWKFHRRWCCTFDRWSGEVEILEIYFLLFEWEVATTVFHKDFFGGMMLFANLLWHTSLTWQKRKKYVCHFNTFFMYLKINAWLLESHRTWKILDYCILNWYWSDTPPKFVLNTEGNTQLIFFIYISIYKFENRWASMRRAIIGMHICCLIRHRWKY